MDYKSILRRVKGISKARTDKELAELFGLSPQNFSFRKQRDTLLPFIVSWGLERNINLNWLLTGRDSESSVLDGADSDSIESLKISELLTETAQVLERGDELSKALSMSIRAHFLTAKKF